MRYPVVIHKDPDSDYGVTVPDLPGCFSAGETSDEALNEVVEAMVCSFGSICFNRAHSHLGIDYPNRPAAKQYIYLC